MRGANDSIRNLLRDDTSPTLEASVIHLNVIQKNRNLKNKKIPGISSTTSNGVFKLFKVVRCSHFYELKSFSVDCPFLHSYFICFYRSLLSPHSSHLGSNSMPTATNLNESILLCGILQHLLPQQLCCLMPIMRGSCLT